MSHCPILPEARILLWLIANQEGILMKWLIAGFASIALAVLCLSICTTEASADRMNGKGNCAGGMCTNGASTWNPSGWKNYQKSNKTTTATKAKQ